MEGFDFGSLGGLGGAGGGGDLVAARSSADTTISYGNRDGALPQWALVAVLAGAGLFAFVGLLLIVRKL